MSARRTLDDQHRLILKRAGLWPPVPVVDPLTGLRADARAECARACAKLRAENREFFARVDREPQ